MSSRTDLDADVVDVTSFSALNVVTGNQVVVVVVVVVVDVTSFSALDVVKTKSLSSLSSRSLNIPFSSSCRLESKRTTPLTT